MNNNYQRQVFEALRAEYPELTRGECETLAYCAAIHRWGETTGTHPIPSIYWETVRRVGKVVEHLKTDKDAFLYRKSKGTAAKLCYQGHLLMENRNGLVVDAQVTQATGTAEREAAVDMAGALSGTHRVTLGADKNYDTRGCVQSLREINVTPHVAQNNNHRSSAIDGRTTRHTGYAAS